MAPETVMLEKSFPVFVMVELTLDVAVVVKMVTVPPAPVFANPVTTRLLLMVWKPLAGNATLFEINVAPPVVFTFRLVKVLPLIFCDKVVAEFVMYICPLLPATECTTPRMSLF